MCEAPLSSVCDTFNHADQLHSFGPFAVNAGYSADVIDWQETVTEKPYYILRSSQAGSIEANSLTVSGALWGTWMTEETNTAGKFPILSRFPDQHGSVDTQADRWILNNAAVALTGKVTDWVTLFAQGEYSDIEFISQDQYQLRKAYAMLGNLDVFPLYAYFGRNTVDFGSMDAYSPFSHSVNNHSFRVDSDDPVLALGYAPAYVPGLNLVATAIPGGRHLRVADSEGEGLFDNFALNGSYTYCFNDDVALTLGGGWLNSTIYDTELAHHPGPTFDQSEAFSQESVENGAWDVNAELKYHGLSIGGEYTTTAERWPATNHLVTAITGQVAYDFAVFTLPTRLSFVYGITQLGPQGTEFEDLKQIAVGLETQVTPNFSLGIEYVRNEAFVPLVAIARASDRDVKTDTVIIGGKLTF
jgi:hypothetical protein